MEKIKIKNIVFPFFNFEHEILARLSHSLYVRRIAFNFMTVYYYRRSPNLELITNPFQISMNNDFYIRDFSSYILFLLFKLNEFETREK